MIRSLLVTIAAGATAGLLLTGASTTLAADQTARPAAPASGPARGPVIAPDKVGAISSGLHPDLSGDALASAARRCANWADKAGFANNGYLGGSLTTAVAIALAESGCNPAACYNDTTGRECTWARTRHSRDSIDRGAWQINSHAWRHVSNSCAYHGQCNARMAYRAVSAYGTYFAPWTTYDTDRFSRYLWAAQRAVNARHRGTITSALIGSCAAHPARGRAGTVTLANCGSAAADQQWHMVGATLRGGRDRCLTAPRHRRRPVTVRHCDGSGRQRWRWRAGATLVSADGLCVTDRGSSLRPGHVLTGGSCAWNQNEAWFAP
jgi:hypothetical protein